MRSLRYIEGVASVAVDRERCVGCGMCLAVCPHQVFVIEEKKASLADRDGCMECGACATNCPVEAITVSPGVGCASLLINRWLNLKGWKKGEAGGCC